MILRDTGGIDSSSSNLWEGLQVSPLEPSGATGLGDYYLPSFG